MSAKYPSLSVVILSGKYGQCAMKKEGSSVHNSNYHTRAFPQDYLRITRIFLRIFPPDYHWTWAARRSTLCPFPVPSHRILKRHAFKGRDLVKLIISAQDNRKWNWHIFSSLQWLLVHYSANASIHQQFHPPSFPPLLQMSTQYKKKKKKRQIVSWHFFENSLTL